nr:ATP synthase F0 subunit 6 [Limnichthys fasciatus]
MITSIFDQFLSPVLMGISLTTVATLLPAMLVVISNSRWSKTRMLAVQGWFFARFIKEVATPLSTPGRKWTLLFMSLLICLMSLNLLGLLPYTFTPTTQLSLNLAMALPLWITTIYAGLRHAPKDMIAHVLPQGTPNALIPMLILVETMSLMIRPIALAMRITANLTAGHLLMHLISAGIFFLMSALPPIALITSLALAALTILEMLVGVLQAYVFVLLLSMYLKEAL